MPAPRTPQARFILARWAWSVHSIIVRIMTPDHTEGLQYHVLPADDPLRTLNILREAAGLQPLSAETLTAGEMSSPKPTATEK